MKFHVKGKPSTLLLITNAFMAVALYFGLLNNKYSLSIGDSSSDTSLDSRVGYLSHAISRDELRPGDHIYSNREIGLYTHHGIYTGIPGREVIHISGPVRGKKSKSSAKVEGVTLDEFLDGHQLRLVPYNSNSWIKLFKRSVTYSTTSSLPPDKVIAKAKYLLNNPEEFGKYHLLNNNCDILAVYCKTGIKPQVTGQFPLLPTCSIHGSSTQVYLYCALIYMTIATIVKKLLSSIVSVFVCK